MRIDFDDLPRAVRERWTAAARDPAAFGGKHGEVRMVGDMLPLVASVIFVAFGAFGSLACLADGFRETGTTMLMFAGIPAGLVWFALRRRATRGRAWEDGGYVFPGCVVIADRRDLDLVPFDRVAPVPTLVSVRGRYSHQYTRIDLADGRAVSLLGPTDEAIRRFNAGRQAYAAARAASDEAAMRAMNPFFDELERGAPLRAPAPEAGEPRLGGMRPWQVLGVAWVLAPLPAAALGWFVSTVSESSRHAREHEEMARGAVAWIDPVLARAATPAAAAVVRGLCEGWKVDLGVDVAPPDTDGLAAAAKGAIPPGDALRAAWEPDLFIDAAQNGINRAIRPEPYPRPPRDDGPVTTLVPRAKAPGPRAIVLRLVPRAAGPAVAVRGTTGSGRCLPLAFRGEIRFEGFASELVVPVYLPGMDGAALARSVAGDPRPLATACYEPQVSNALVDAGRLVDPALSGPRAP